MTTPSLPIETENPTVDPRELLARAATTTASVIAEITPDQLAAPTPCAEMDVRAMLGHLVGVLGRVSALGRGEDPFAVVETAAVDDRWADAWADAVADAAAAWHDDEVLDRPMALPWIQAPGGEVLATYLSEISVHTWDLATAIGVQPAWDDTVITAALNGPAILPAENRRQLFEEISAAQGFDDVPIPFGEAVPIADVAPAIDRLVAWNGRSPSR